MEAVKMKLVILGNGFDLANKLPTKYENFFDYYSKLYKKEFRYIKEMLYITKKSSLNEDLSGVIEQESYLKVENELRKEMQNDFKINQSLIDNEHITLWNLYFWFVREKSEMNNWSDVEGQIDRLINNFSDLTLLDPAQKINHIENLIEKWYTDNIAKTRGGITDYKIDYKKNIYAALSKDDRFRFICDSIVLERYKKSKDDEDIYYLNVLKKELEFFEEEFKKYISIISEIIIDKHKKAYRLNLLKVAGVYKSAEIYLLNFNYTEFSRAGATKIDTVTMSNNKEHIEIMQINVHGTHHSKIIFGIDQTNQTEKKFYQFTKTYRKMECADKIATIQLPYPNDIDEIIIYGHSLSKADYSYFHSIFDYYDIYGSNIKLKFKYSTHGDPYVCKSNHVQKMMELIKTYGDKMFDTARGDNLVHKLLLENRLSIEEVVLKELNDDILYINKNNLAKSR
jgi:hypothetical protein